MAQVPGVGCPVLDQGQWYGLVGVGVRARGWEPGEQGGHSYPLHRAGSLFPALQSLPPGAYVLEGQAHDTKKTREGR